MYKDVGREFFHRNPVEVYKHAWDLLVAAKVTQEAT